MGILASALSVHSRRVARPALTSVSQLRGEQPYQTDANDDQYRNRLHRRSRFAASGVSRRNGACTGHRSTGAQTRVRPHWWEKRRTVNRRGQEAQLRPAQPRCERLPSSNNPTMVAPCAWADLATSACETPSGSWHTRTAQPALRERVEHHAVVPVPLCARKMR